MRSERKKIGALEDADEQQVAAGVVLRDLAAELADAPREVIGLDEDLADGFVAHERRSVSARCRAAVSDRAAARGGRRRRAAGRRGLDAQHPALDDRAGAVAEVERAVAEREDVAQARGGARAQPAGGVLGEPPQDEPRQRGRQRARGARPRSGRGRRARSRRPRRARRPPRAAAPPSARRCAPPPDAARAARARGRHARGCARTRGRRWIRPRATRSPRAAQCAAVSARVTPQQRAHEQPVALGHAEQRAAARRRGEPVEDGLGLVGRGVARRQPSAERRRHARAGAQPHVARPRLEVAGVLGAPRREDLELDVALGAQRAGRAPRPRRPPRAGRS